MTAKLSFQMMNDALLALENKLPEQVRLILGGGGAMVLAHGFRVATTDVDAVPMSGLSVTELAPYVRQVATELSLSTDWLNAYYSTFAHVLPSDYGTRLIRVIELPKLLVDALSADDLLVMKCFAARQKDVVHARVLVRRGARISFVRKHLEHLSQMKVVGAEKAMKFLSDIELFFARPDE